MNILMVHNRYLQAGGEDSVFAAESEILASYGHQVQTYVVENDQIFTEYRGRKKINLALNTIWSGKARLQMERILTTTKPEIAHFHNTFPLISPAVYSIAKQYDVPVVQTLHNYRLLCPSANFFRDGQVCEDCLTKSVAVPSLVHACYRGSRAQTGTVAAMLSAHRLLRTWTRHVDRYIALTDFARGKFIEGGLPGDRIVVKPNFVSFRPQDGASERESFLFVGRLVPEKGIATLIEAARMLGSDGPSIRIAGDGPLSHHVEEASLETTRMVLLGRLNQDSVRAEMSKARALIMPSEWYETFGLTIVEAFANTTPVIASRLGAMSELVADGRTGLLFEPGNSNDLAAKVRWAAEHPTEMRRMGENARREYEARYTPSRNYKLLLEIYREAIEHSHKYRARVDVGTEAMR